MEHFSEKRYPVGSTEYKLYEEIGEGVSATVYRALCVPLNEIVAVKVLDLERCNNDLDGIRREVQTMSLIDHPNVLQAHCSFTTDRSLWVVMPYMAGGSCLHIMKSAYPDGFEEPVIATLLWEVLKALVYLHSQGHIHRDVKAGNILIDENGAVKLADFGVSACMFDTGDRQRSRNTFVGTPCWMAPEVMQQLHGYDFKADIWSFGITALELAHGHAPFSKYPPMKVLLMTLQNAPPGLDYERDKRFSKSFKEMVATCLVKDPKKRPTSEKLLKHHFFKHARSNEYLACTILSGLHPLGERFRMLKAKDADFLLQNKVMYGNKEHLSQVLELLTVKVHVFSRYDMMLQNTYGCSVEKTSVTHQEYIQGISGWNFNLEDLKTQAALIQDGDEISNAEYPVANNKGKNESNGAFCAPNVPLTERIDDSKVVTALKDGSQELLNADGSVSSFPISLQPLKGYFDVCEDDVNGSSPNCKDALQSDSEQLFQLQQSQAGEQEITRHNGDVERISSLPQHIAIPGQPQKFFSGSLLAEHALSSSRKVDADGDRENLQQKHPVERYYSGPLSCRQKRDINIHTATNMHALDDTSEGTVVQRKGRFKVTSADVGVKGSPSNRPVSPVGQASNNSIITASSILPSLQYLLQQNALQREQIIKLIKSLEQTSGHRMAITDVPASDLPQLSPTLNRERELQSQVLHLQQSVNNISEELQMLKLKNAELQCHLDELRNKEKRTRI